MIWWWLKGANKRKQINEGGKDGYEADEQAFK